MTPSSPPPEYSRFPRLRYKPLPRLRRELQYWLVFLLFAIAARIPVRASQALGRWLGRLLFPIVRRDRRIAEYQLGLVYPELDEDARRALARRNFEQMGMTLMETLAITRIRREAARWLHMEGEAQLRAAYGEGRGVILITGHMANWELYAVLFDLLEIPARAVVRPFVNPRLNDLAIRQRRSTHLQPVQRGSRESPRQLLTCLKQGQVLIVALDHDTNVPGVFVEFFGRPAYTPRVAASLALRMGVPVVTGFDRRLEDGSHCFAFRRVPPPEGLRNDQEGVRAFTQLFSDAMEAHIREYPEQWTWNHRRWKRRPEDAPA